MSLFATKSIHFQESCREKNLSMNKVVYVATKMLNFKHFELKKSSASIHGSDAPSHH